MKKIRLFCLSLGQPFVKGEFKKIMLYLLILLATTIIAPLPFAWISYSKIQLDLSFLFIVLMAFLIGTGIKERYTSYNNRYIVLAYFWFVLIVHFYFLFYYLYGTIFFLGFRFSGETILNSLFAPYFINKFIMPFFYPSTYLMFEYLFSFLSNCVVLGISISMINRYVTTKSTLLLSEYSEYLQTIRQRDQYPNSRKDKKDKKEDDDLSNKDDSNIDDDSSNNN